MNHTKELTERFKALYERFLIGCDAIEETGAWNLDEFGEMDVFYENDLVGVILRLIASDGVVRGNEVRYLNENFGFDYSTEELAAVYESGKEEIDRSFDDNFLDGMTKMKAINAKLADCYREMLGLICDIISESDHDISDEEVRMIEQLKEKLS